ncbi:M23 family metallopeptidase, partial [Pseudonocardia alni]
PDGAGPAPAPPRPPGAGIPAPGADYAWPLLPPPAVTAVFRKPAFRYGRGHRGADLGGSPGQAVLVAREGVVVFAGRIAGRGVVSVDHPDGLRSTYEPVTAVVAAGARLAGGDPVGTLEPGHIGCPVAACLHWGVRRERLDHLDPLVLLRPPRVRLLPWEGAPEPAGDAPDRVSPPAPAASTPAAG